MKRNARSSPAREWIAAILGLAVLLGCAGTDGARPASARAPTPQPAKADRTAPSAKTAAPLSRLKNAPDAAPAPTGKGKRPDKASEKTPQPKDTSPHEDVVVEDFEKQGFNGWKVTGEAFGPGPSRGKVGRQNGVVGYEGHGLANSFWKDDRGKGRLTSPAFTVNRKFMAFRIGGGNHPGQTCVNLLVDGKPVRTATGRNKNRLHQVAWDVAALQGKKARIEIVDDHGGFWGYVSADHFVLSDAKPRAKVAKAPPPRRGREPRLQAPKFLKRETWANKDLVMNPVAIAFDGQGRLFVAETHRFRYQGVADLRERAHWFMDDVACRTVDDRRKMYEKYANEFPLSFYREKAERIRLLTDTDGDGKADTSVVYADGFNDPLDGTAAGIIERDGKVYFACLPHLWKLEDRDGDGTADSRESLQRGFGIHIGISGHDMHGLIWGPDGKLYWSIGDRGYNLKTKEGRHLANPWAGAVFRCEPDGSELEVFYYGLRNPQELVFDKYGNLFTGDNNANLGDRSRINYLVEGGDTGWHAGWQWLGTMNNRIRRFKLDNPWNVEKFWHTSHEGQPAFLLPPVGWLTSGPSGITVYPGTGLPAEYNDTFFIADYKGGAANSGVLSFKVEPDGAGYKLGASGQFIKGIANTDVTFGYDGRMYIADYIGGWQTPWKGNIFVFYHPEEVAKPVVKEVQTLFAEGFAHRTSAVLAALLSHIDQRVRLRAQFALTEKSDALTRFMRVVKQSESELARLHAVWGLGRLLRTNRLAEPSLVGALADKSPHVRAQAAKALGDGKFETLSRNLAALLKDESPRVRMLAAIALGKQGNASDVDALVRLLETNADKDVFVRHGGVMGLYGIAKRHKNAPLDRHASASSKSVRMGVLLAWRKLDDKRISRFLNDADAGIVMEAIRAINGRPIQGALPALAAHLAKHLDKPRIKLSRLSIHRMINANFRLGTPPAARRLLQFAGDDRAGEGERIRALHVLEDWAFPEVDVAQKGKKGFRPSLDPIPIDPTLGLYRPLPPRKASDIEADVRQKLAALLKKAKGNLLAETTRLAVRFQVDLDADFLIAQARNGRAAKAVRLEVIRQLAKRDHPDRVAVLEKLLKDRDIDLRLAAARSMATADPQKGLAAALEFLKKGSDREKQEAYGMLGDMAHPAAAARLAAAMDDLDRVPAAVRLDVVEASAQSRDGAVRRVYKRWKAALPAGDPLAAFRLALEGGDADRGRELFLTHGVANCVRCHAVGGQGGDAGPDLSGVGVQYDGDSLLASLILPNAAIAPGFGVVALKLKDGTSAGGTLLSESNGAIRLRGTDGKTIQIAAARVKERSTPVSSMPPMGLILSKREVRDVLAFLRTLQSPRRPGDLDGGARALGWRLGTQAYTFKDFTFFEAVEKAAAMGLKYIEAFPGQRVGAGIDGKFDPSLPSAARGTIREKLKAAGVTLVAYGVVTARTPADWRRHFALAKDLGVEIVTAEPEPKHLDAIERLTEEFDIKLAIHNHPKNSRYWNPDTVLAAVQGRSKRMGACADTGHWARSGLDPVAALRKLEGRIISLHFKDLNGRRNNAHDVVWGTGKCNAAGMLAELKRQGFRGLFSVEYEHNWKKNEPEIRKSVVFFNKTASKLADASTAGQ